MSAGRRLLRALSASAETAGCVVTLTGNEQPWASATFVGARHAITVEGACAAWLDGLTDAGLAVPGHVVAELAVERAATGTLLRVLTLEA